MALLPYLDGYELVLTTAPDKAQEMLKWEDAVFLQFLQEHFGERVGAFTGIGRRDCYPLRLKRAPDITFPYTVLIGNAAQTLHPVAGQGFNMGIRDAWELAQVILDSAPDGIGSAAMCAEYRKSRRIDRNAGIRFTDGLVRLFSNDLPLLGPRAFRCTYAAGSHSTGEKICGEENDVWGKRLMVAEQHNAQLSILFADISGSTALYDKLGNERALQLITRTLDILILEMAKHQGTLIKTIGDEIMCTFPDVATAVIAAQAMQFALEGQSHANGHQIYVRIGIHYGDVIQESGDVFGDAVNVAARVAAITRARQILTTQAVVDMLPQELRHSARPVMRAELRGKETALNVFQIIWEKDDTMSTRIGMSTFRKPAEPERKNELLLRYRQQVLTLNEQQRSALLGRDESCNLVIQSKLASRQHGRIEYSYGKFLYTDHSANGTYIRFSDSQAIQLHQQQIVLHGSGSISLGQSFAEAPTEVIEYILQ